MYYISWDVETGGVVLRPHKADGTLGVAPRPVFWEELDMLRLHEAGWVYPHSEAPLLWAVNKQYWYRGEMVFEVKGANVYNEAKVVFAQGKGPQTLDAVDVDAMLRRNGDQMFLLESEALEFIRDVYLQYADVRNAADAELGGIDYEALCDSAAKRAKRRMAIVKEGCDSFDIMPLDVAERQGRRTYHTTRVDRIIASFSGGKDSQVVLDLCARTIPPSAFEVVYADTGYELPTSLQLYEQTRRHYQGLFPALRFSLARNHADVLSYWDRLGTPSDTHRWCCSVMKTAPIYRLLNANGKHKVMAFDGVRAEESLMRGSYYRLGKGKHASVYNAHPILHWNAVEVFLYLFARKIPINEAYRGGKARVGCLICPFATAWDDMIAHRQYPRQFSPFLRRLETWTQLNGITQTKDFIAGRAWKIKAVGDTVLSNVVVDFSEGNHGLTAHVRSPTCKVYDWLGALCEYVVISSSPKEDRGELKYKGRICDFKLSQKLGGYVFSVENTDVSLNNLLRRVIYKRAYCVNCETCEVECPTGALSVVPKVEIDKAKCIHCHKCLTFHDRGCISADSVRMIKDMNESENVKIQGYKTFGFREQWLRGYFEDPEGFLTSSSLGPAQVDGLKAWLKDSGVNDAKNRLTAFGDVLRNVEDERLVWELILTNLSYESFVVNWFCNNVGFGQQYNRKSLVDLINGQGYSSKGKTVDNAVGALVQSMDHSPLGEVLRMGEPVGEGNVRRRAEYSEATTTGVAYNLYKYAAVRNVRHLRVADFFSAECENGPHKTLGVSQPTFERLLRALNSAPNRVLVAELNMGLDSITLRDDLTPLTCLEALLA